MPKKKTSTTASHSVSQSEITNLKSIDSLKKKRNEPIVISKLVKNLINQDISALSKAITLIESKSPKHSKKAKLLLEACLPHANRSIRIGITGVPGVGKSTFIEAFGTYLTGLGKRVAILAIDPSSSISKGSILGDKTRMEALVKDKKAFIRPSATGESLGGTARTTRESVVLCEAAGYDIIIIETVGVGQSETKVRGMVDFFLLLKLAGAGDELQGIKRGIIELADAIAINKSDGNNVKAALFAMKEFKRALHLFPARDSGWFPKVMTCSALRNEGISNIWNMITEYVELTRNNGYFDKIRQEQNKTWLIQTIESRLKSRFFNADIIKKALPEQLDLIEKNKITPFAAADYLLSLSEM